MRINRRSTVLTADRWRIGRVAVCGFSAICELKRSCAQDFLDMDALRGIAFMLEKLFDLRLCQRPNPMSDGS